MDIHYYDFFKYTIQVWGKEYEENTDYVDKTWDIEIYFSTVKVQLDYIKEQYKLCVEALH